MNMLANQSKCDNNLQIFVQLFGVFSSFCDVFIHFLPFCVQNSLIITYIYIKSKLHMYLYWPAGHKTIATPRESCKLCDDIFLLVKTHLLGPFSGFFLWRSRLFLSRCKIPLKTPNVFLPQKISSRLYRICGT